MSTVACPSCGMPRAEELVGETPCPVCGHVGLPDAEPLDEPTPAPATASPAPPAPSPRGPSSAGRVVAVGVLAFLVGTAAGALGLAAWQTAAGPREQATADDTSGGVTPPGSPQTGASDTAPPPGPASPSGGSRPPLARSPEPLPSPREPVARAAPPNPPPAPAVNPPKEQPVAAGPPGPVDPALVNPFRPAAAPAVRLDNPAGITSPVVRPGSTLVLRGRVKTLRVAGLESGAVLDASDLEAEEVIVVGKIDGGSRLWVRAPNGRVTFLARVAGLSRVRVVAPGGAVTFALPTAPQPDGAAITGGAAVEITARAVQLNGRVHGDGTRVAVTLTAGGSLSFREMDGACRLEYGTADPEDDEPSVSKGKVGPGAVVKKVEWE